MGAAGAEGVNGLVDTGEDDGGVVEGDGSDSAVLYVGRHYGGVKSFLVWLVGVWQFYWVMADETAVGWFIGLIRLMADETAVDWLILSCVIGLFNLSSNQPVRVRLLRL
jgi:hypothetical protein